MASIQLDDVVVEAPLPTFIAKQGVQSVYNTLIEHGQPKITAILAANRLQNNAHETLMSAFCPSISNINYRKLKDVEKAAERICEAFQNNEKMGIVVDFDVDGINSGAVVKRALTQYMGFDPKNVEVFVNNRNLFGYGFNEKALKHMIDVTHGDLPTLLMTADQGSNENNTIKQYKDYMLEHHGNPDCDVIITDHHHIDKGSTCPDAVAFVNPQQHDCEFEDPTICGCVVALLVMIVTREKMIEKGLLTNDAPKLSSLFTYACLATVADCVSLSSSINRYIVRIGLRDMSIGANPQWRILKQNLKYNNGQIGASDLGFTLGPLINSDSRTGGDGSDALNFLLAEDDETAERYYLVLKERNEARKVIDHNMQKDAFVQASRQYNVLGRRGLSIYLSNGDHAIQGIVASRIKEAFQCPVVIFSPTDIHQNVTDSSILTASARCIDGMSVVDIVKGQVGQHLTIEGGGHPAAMGLRLAMRDYEAFSELFDQYVKEAASKAGMINAFTPSIKIDHYFQSNDLCLLDDVALLSDISTLEPYGIKFEAPIFAMHARILNVSTFGKGDNLHAHANVVVLDEMGRQRRITVFSYAKCPWMECCIQGADVEVAFTVNYDSYRNRVGLLAVAMASKRL